MNDVPSFLRKNAIPELDFSGIIAVTGPSVPPIFTPGTRVFGTIPPAASAFSGVGTLAEYTIVHSDYVQVIPSTIAFEEAATFGGLAQTALKILEKGAVAGGDCILIHGASGGIGIMATQLAKAKGATVVATSSSSKLQMVNNAGADEVSCPNLFIYKHLSLQVIDYRANRPLHVPLTTSYGD